MFLHGHNVFDSRHKYGLRECKNCLNFILLNATNSYIYILYSIYPIIVDSISFPGQLNASGFIFISLPKQHFIGTIKYILLNCGSIRSLSYLNYLAFFSPGTVCQERLACFLLQLLIFGSFLVEFYAARDDSAWLNDSNCSALRDCRDTDMNIFKRDLLVQLCEDERYRNYE